MKRAIRLAFNPFEYGRDGKATIYLEQMISLSVLVFRLESATLTQVWEEKNVRNR